MCSNCGWEVEYESEPTIMDTVDALELNAQRLRIWMDRSISYAEAKRRVEELEAAHERH